MVAKSVQILVIEDESADVDLLKIGLSEMKIANKLIVARDGIEAITLLKKKNKKPEETPDLIFLDLNLPGKSGREILNEIKSDQSLSHIPVVIMTSSDSEDDVLRSYQLHASCYIRKPVGIEEFQKVVQSFEKFWFEIVTLPMRNKKA